MTTEKAQKLFEQIIRDSPTLSALFTTRQPNYRYYSPKGSEDEYFWTIEALKIKGKPRYASGIYRHIKTRGQMKLTNERYHVRRKDAKARALKLYQAAQKEDYGYNNSQG